MDRPVITHSKPFRAALTAGRRAARPCLSWASGRHWRRSGPAADPLRGSPAAALAGADRGRGARSRRAGHERFRGGCVGSAARARRVAAPEIRSAGHGPAVKANLRPDAGRSAGVVVAFDPVRFTSRAILDSADITAMRTAAIAAVAARRLARPGDHSVAVIGAGPVGRHSLAALAAASSDVSDVRLWSRRPGPRTSTPPACRTRCGCASQSREAVAGPTWSLTATPSREPLLQAADLTPGALVLAMGADTAREAGAGRGCAAGRARWWLTY